MEQNKFKNVLSALEADNAAELNSHTDRHRFPISFERRAVSACRGAAACDMPRRFRRLPLWAAVLIAVLVCALVTGCAVAAYKYFTRYIPNYGIIDMFSDIKMLATEDALDVGDMKIETVLYIRDGDSGIVRLWTTGPALSGGWGDNEWRKTPIFTLKTDKGEYPVFAKTASVGADGGFYECEAQNVEVFESAVIVRGGSEKVLALRDISEKGYTVSAWAEYDGITIKALPLYVNNRIIILCTEGIANAWYVSATLTVYDSLGNTVKVGSGSEENGGQVLTAKEKLPGEVIKIEVDSLRVHCTLPEKVSFEISVPSADGEYPLDLRLIDNDVFTENAVNIKREGEYIYLTTKIDTHKYEPLTDFYIDYDSQNARIEDWSTVGIDTVIYKLKIGADTEKITLTVNEYIYMIRGKQDKPLGTIEIKKSK